MPGVLYLWRRCVDRYDRPGTVFFLDPPYWQTEGYGVPFEWPEYESLAEVLRGLKGRAILTINDHPDVRRLFSGLPLQVVPIRYTIGGGKGVARRELIYRTWN
jgi:DNA adenine methylase